MKIIRLKSIVLLTTISLLGGCNSNLKTSNTPTKSLSAETLALGISDVPKVLLSTYSKALTWSTKFTHPS